MRSLIGKLHDYVRANGSPYAPVNLDFLSLAADSIALRVEPGTATESRDLSGARFGDFRYSIYCKSDDPAKASGQLYRYMEALDLEEFRIDDGLTVISEPETEPHFISQNADKTVVYTAGFHIEYREEE